MDFLIGILVMIAGIILLIIGVKQSDGKKASDVSFSLPIKLIIAGIGISIFGLYLILTYFGLALK